MGFGRELKKLFSKFGLCDDPRREKFNIIPDGDFYRPVFSPWYGEGYGDFRSYYAVAKSASVVSADRCYMLYTLAKQAAQLDGQWYECGVYKGGTASMLARLLADQPHTNTKKLHLFDSFEGMPETHAEKDLHKSGDFSDTSLEAVKTLIESYIPNNTVCEFHKGFIPDTFKGLDDHKIAFAHVDVDIYQAILDCCEFIYPRLLRGGFMIFDDYGFGSCPGAREAVDRFFKDKPEIPLVLPTGQALIFKSH